MPELPEVETVRRTLYDKVVGRRVCRVEVITPRQIYHPDPDTFRAEVEGACFTDIERRGKWLIFLLGPRESEVRLIGHLRMSGHLYVCDPQRPRDKHTHLVFHLENGTELRYDDQRKFGGFHLVGKSGAGMPPGLRDIGPEPLSDAFTPAALRQALAGRRTAIKAALLNQQLVAGLGNIYVDEALFCARIHPARTADSVTPEEADRLHGCIRKVLERAVARRGTTFSLYVDGTGQAGDMYEELQVFDRTGEPCPACGSPIIKLEVAQRGTHLCLQCQPAPEGAVHRIMRARPGRRGESISVAAEPPRPYGKGSKAKGDQ